MDNGLCSAFANRRGWRTDRCTNKAKVVREGRRFCGVHDPEPKRLEREKETKALAERWARAESEKAEKAARVADVFGSLGWNVEAAAGLPSAELVSVPIAWLEKLALERAEWSEPGNG